MITLAFGQMAYFLHRRRCRPMAATTVITIAEPVDGVRLRRWLENDVAFSTMSSSA